MVTCCADCFAGSGGNPENVFNPHECELLDTAPDEHACFFIKRLNLITFFTSGPQETRAWTVPNGSTAPQAAGKIHTDMEKGFIRAEVVPWEQYVTCGSWSEARKHGYLRVEGKNYLVQDGDILVILFSR